MKTIEITIPTHVLDALKDGTLLNCSCAEAENLVTLFLDEQVDILNLESWIEQAWSEGSLLSEISTVSMMDFIESDGVETEKWQCKITGDVFEVPLELKRDWKNMKKL